MFFYLPSSTVAQQKTKKINVPYLCFSVQDEIRKTAAGLARYSIFFLYCIRSYDILLFCYEKKNLKYEKYLQVWSDAFDFSHARQVLYKRYFSF
jgi:hypothetical protein